MKKFLRLKNKNTVPWTYVISDFNAEGIVEIFYEQELRKPNQKVFRVAIVIRRKDDKLYVKCKRLNNYLNSWID